MIGIDEALERIDSAVEAPPAEDVEIGEAVGRVSAEALAAKTALPPFAQSAMDGYGLRAEDVASAEVDTPVRLRVVGDVAAGPSAEPPTVGSGEAVRIFTGAPIPEGVDAVVRQERVRRDGDEVVLEDSLSPGNDIRPVGEELSEGTPISGAGVRLRPGTIGRASQAGIAEVSVHPRPSVAVLVTGSEVRPAGEPLELGELYDANAPILAAWLDERRIPHSVRHVADERDEVAEALDESLDMFDLVVTTGGVSVGDYDYVVGTVAEVGVEEVFWKIRQRPGKPVWFGTRGETPLLGLPGNPGAVYVGAYVYLQRVLDRLDGLAEPGPDWQTGRLSRSVSLGSKATLAGARMSVADGVVCLEPELGHQSHRMSRLAGSDALVWIPEGEGEIVAGETVKWIPTQT